MGWRMDKRRWGKRIRCKEVSLSSVCIEMDAFIHLLCFAMDICACDQVQPSLVTITLQRDGSPRDSICPP